MMAALSATDSSNGGRAGRAAAGTKIGTLSCPVAIVAAEEIGRVGDVPVK